MRAYLISTNFKLGGKNKMKMHQRVFALLLALVLVVGVLPVATSAADSVMDTVLQRLGYCELHSEVPSVYANGITGDSGSITKKAGETGFNQDLPRATVGYDELFPDYYTAASYTVSNEGIISDGSFKLAYQWPQRLRQLRCPAVRLQGCENGNDDDILDLLL